MILRDRKFPEDQIEEMMGRWLSYLEHAVEQAQEAGELPADISARENDHLIVEEWQGGRPSRGVIYYGEPATSDRIRIHVDRAPGRMLRSWWRTLSRFSGG